MSEPRRPGPPPGPVRQVPQAPSAAPTPTKPKRLSPEDAAKLKKGFVETAGNQRYWLNKVPLPAPGLICPNCGAAKGRPLPHDQTWAWCSGCGRRAEQREFKQPKAPSRG